MNLDTYPPPARVAAAAVCLGLAWWAFGRAGTTHRRPWVVWTAGFGAAWLVPAGEGVAFLIGRHARGWLPAVAVGVVGSWFVLRGRRGTADGRRWAAGAVALLVAAPFLSKANAVAEAAFGPAERLAALTGLSPWETGFIVEDALGGTVVLLGAACVAAAAWPRFVPEQDGPAGAVNPPDAPPAGGAG